MQTPRQPDPPLILGQDTSGRDLALALPDRLRHTYVLGQTGTGKSTLLHNLVWQDLVNGSGLTLIDPHGDLVEELLRHYPPHRTDDLVLFDATDPTHAIRFNPLDVARRTPGTDDRAVAALVAAFKHVWSDSWGPRLEYILTRALATLIPLEHTTLLDVMRLFTDERFRRRTVERTRDPVLRAFWLGEFDAWDKRFRTEAVAPIQNKLGQLAGSQTLRRIIGQHKPGFDVRLLLDTRRVLLVNLSKGRLGDANAALLGAMLVSALHQAALSRADAPADQRPPHHLYIDEFPLVATDAFASIFSEARKYGLSLTLAHQYLAQADPRTLDAVFGNVGTLVALRPGEEDAGRLARALGGRFAPEHLAGQDNFCAVLRLLSKGSPVGPINARLFPAVNSPTHRSGWLRVHSRRRFSTAIPVVKGHGL